MEETLNEINETIETPAEDQPETTNEPVEEIPETDTLQEEEEIVVPKDWSEWDEHEFSEGEIFTNEYPPQAAVWCNEGGTHHIEEIEPDEDGNRRFQIVKNPEPTAEEIAERKAMLNLTAADVERAIYKAKGMDFDDVIALVEQYNENLPSPLAGGATHVDTGAVDETGASENEVTATIPSPLAGCKFEQAKNEPCEIVCRMAEGQGEGSTIDIKALKIELKANNFYRGNPYIDAVGQLLGFTSEQLDNFFETGDYMELLNG